MLKIENLTKCFGSLKVINNLNFEVVENQALGVLGPNGAGKSTLFNLITGDVKKDSGSIRFYDKEISNLTPHNRCRDGIGRTYQIPHPFENMTVFENLLVGSKFGAGKSNKESYSDCYLILDDLGLLSKANNLAGTLTLLDRKRLELARALATRPKLLLLDEIAGGLTDPECQELIKIINNIKKQGVTIIWIEHVLNALLSVVDKLMVIDFGKKIVEGEPNEIMNSSLVQELYTGVS